MGQGERWVEGEGLGSGGWRRERWNGPEQPCGQEKGSSGSH
uniref:Uncharacterized protein n=1 Tax=Arundo donax TaxID=35708 RepID=A0A0A8YTT5_ARUDO